MPTSEEISAFAGKNGAYYARAWKRLGTPGPTTAGFNGAAFFCSYFWILYRRLYDLAAIFGALFVIEVISSDWYFTSHPQLQEAQRSWDLLIRVVISVVAGQFGNLWYLRHATRMIDYARRKQVEPATLGGTSTVAVLIGTAAIIAAAGIAFVVSGFFQGVAPE
jgi:hypothetical protein